MIDLASAAATAAGEPPVPIDLAAARRWLLAAPRGLAALPAGQLAETLNRIRRCYDEYPELELAAPRSALIAELRGLAGAAGEALAVPLLMAAAVLEASAAPDRVTDLLLCMARSDYANAIGEVIAVLSERRPLTWREIAPALDELCRRRQLAIAIEVVSRGLDRVASDDDGATELGTALHLLLPESRALAADPATLVRTVVSARRRINPRDYAGWSGHIAALPDGVMRNAPPLRPRPPHIRLPQPGGGAVEWLPSMEVGQAGRRTEHGIETTAGQTGHLVYGPYVELGAGDYQVRVTWETGSPWRTVRKEEPVVVIEAVSRYGRLYLAQRELTVAECAAPQHELRFRLVARSAPAFEVRVWTGSIVPLTVTSITLARIARRNAAPIAGATYAAAE